MPYKMKQMGKKLGSILGNHSVTRKMKTLSLGPFLSSSDSSQDITAHSDSEQVLQLLGIS